MCSVYKNTIWKIMELFHAFEENCFSAFESVQFYLLEQNVVKIMATQNAASVPASELKNNCRYYS